MSINVLIKRSNPDSCPGTEAFIKDAKLDGTPRGAAGRVRGPVEVEVGFVVGGDVDGGFFLLFFFFFFFFFFFGLVFFDFLEYCKAPKATAAVATPTAARPSTSVQEEEEEEEEEEDEVLSSFSPPSAFSWSARDRDIGVWVVRGVADDFSDDFLMVRKRGCVVEFQVWLEAC
jgi:hypothetical protein